MKRQSPRNTKPKRPNHDRIECFNRLIPSEQIRSII